MHLLNRHSSIAYSGKFEENRFVCEMFIGLAQTKMAATMSPCFVWSFYVWQFILSISILHRTSYLNKIIYVDFTTNKILSLYLNIKNRMLSATWALVLDSFWSNFSKMLMLFRSNEICSLNFNSDFFNINFHVLLSDFCRTHMNFFSTYFTIY